MKLLSSAQAQTEFASLANKKYWVALAEAAMKHSALPAKK